MADDDDKPTPRNGTNPNVFQNPKQFESEMRDIEKKLQLTPEELALIKERKAHYFWMKDFPLTIGGMMFAQYMVRSGRWQPNPRWGALPKSLGLGLFVYLVSGFTSSVAIAKEFIKQRKQGGTMEDTGNQYGRLPAEGPVDLAKLPESSFPTNNSTKPRRKNKYGDDIFTDE